MANEQAMTGIAYVVMENSALEPMPPKGYTFGVGWPQSVLAAEWCLWGSLPILKDASEEYGANAPEDERISFSGFFAPKIQ